MTSRYAPTPELGAARTERLVGTRPLQLQGLTGLRGIGALWVFLFHVQYGLEMPILRDGWLGVDMFFILSGFVLSHAHPAEEWTLGTYGRFLQARIARIFPLHVVALLLVAFVAITYPGFVGSFGSSGREKYSLAEFIASLFLVQSWGIGEPAPWNSPAWSLSAEWFVSLAFPMILLGVRRIATARMALAMAALAMLAFVIFLFVTHNPSAAVSGRSGLVRVVCEFSTGCLAYRAYSSGFRGSRGIASAALALFGIGIAFPALVNAALFSFPVIVILSAQNETGVSRFLSTSVMQFFGRISYSFYLFHWILLQISNRLAISCTPCEVHGVLDILWFCALFGLTVGLSTLTYRLIEIPMRRWVRSLNLNHKRLIYAED
jgi:peptidoglycan/LPS O-acetylase OafA/YrhL